MSRTAFVIAVNRGFIFTHTFFYITLFLFIFRVINFNKIMNNTFRTL